MATDPLQIPLLRNRKDSMANKDDFDIHTDNPLAGQAEQHEDLEHTPSFHASQVVNRSTWHRDRYAGAVLYNFVAFMLPALYGTLSKLWIANIDASLVVTTDSYTYIGVVAEVLNEGLPRAAWVVIGDRESRTLQSRTKLATTLVAFQALMGLLLSIIICAGAKAFSSAFVPSTVRTESLQYVRISSFECLTSAIETSVASATRSLDRPDVPLLISSIKFAVNITLDLLFLSWFRPLHRPVNINTQAYIRLACDLSSAIAGLAYFVWRTSHQCKKNSSQAQVRSMAPDLKSLGVLARPGIMTFIESAIRNALYLWLVSNIVALGADFATAWGVFNSIRWGMVMVPVQTLEATSLAFTGHAWGKWRKDVGVSVKRVKATRSDILSIMRPALASLAIALVIEVPLCIFLTLFGCQPYALWLSNSPAVADITAYMWRAIDWCYICYGAYTQMATILLATRPRWYLYQSLVSNIFYVLPWAIVCQIVSLSQQDAWKYYRFVFGGSLVFSFVDVLVVVGLWAWVLMSGTARLESWKSAD